MLRLLSENFVLKVIALATSLMIWFYASEERNPVTSKRVNAEVRLVGTVPDDLLARIRTDPVLVELSGPRNEVEAVTDNDIKVRVNQSRLHANDRRASIEEVERPPSAPNVAVKLLQLYVEASVTRKLSRKVKIEPVFNNDAPLGRVYSSSPRLDPIFATVVGSKDELDRVAKLRVYVETKGGNVRGDLPIQAVDRDDVRVDSVRIDPDRTHVELNLEEAPATRTLLVSVRHIGRPAPQMELTDISVKPDQVTVSGRPDALLQLTNVVTADVNLDGVAGSFTRDVPLRLPDGIRIKGGRPVVSVTVKIRDTAKPGR